MMCVSYLWVSANSVEFAESKGIYALITLNVEMINCTSSSSGEVCP